ncbi:MAG: hypothetical protein A2782_02195 [Candidatus Blackburnbacteria bacterium RIFCSPHIGHO2_01_FULL_43_15b]|uniref:BrnT family toxin n=1 Tax=Candidatus Blackburnbacteria bacterium RIFCSPHIGHO2_01_FULL_43_15b TaxID=1797513 RepID=A0A1G1V082_9BACT|nr:MAG: hypothetical protein A2782_02195 [Candidatus Blackburnbacteria bacterium RIFCSPHIGHO2_01_FULL_43_15b]
MLDLGKITGFEWDRGNLEKSRHKHGVTARETEEVFLDKDVGIEDDIKHQEIEKRYIAIGKTQKERLLFIAFTVRNHQIRVIPARVANKKERRLYETKENS